MATEKYIKVQEYSDADLQSELEGTQTAYQKMKFDHALKGLDNPLLLREARRDIARLQTEIRRRQLANASEETIANRSRIRARRRKKN